MVAQTRPKASPIAHQAHIAAKCYSARVPLKAHEILREVEIVCCVMLGMLACWLTSSAINRPPVASARSGHAVSRRLGYGGGTRRPLLSSAATRQSLKAGIQCGYNGVKSDSAGRCVSIPGAKLIAQDAQVRSLTTVETDQLALLTSLSPNVCNSAETQGKIIGDRPIDPGRGRHLTPVSRRQ
jgi:hypothetical protein